DDQPGGAGAGAAGRLPGRQPWLGARVRRRRRRRLGPPHQGVRTGVGVVERLGEKDEVRDPGTVPPGRPPPASLLAVGRAWERSKAMAEPPAGPSRSWYRRPGVWYHLVLAGLLLVLGALLVWRPLDSNLDFWVHSAVGGWMWRHGQVPYQTLFLWS